MPYTNAAGLRKFLKKKMKMVVKCFAAFAVYMFFVKISLEERVQEVQNHRSLQRDLFTTLHEDNTCDIGSPTGDALPATAGATTTLLASYPGSGKRFTWTLIKALTNREVADDWNFSGKLQTSPLTIKSSWPHKEGIWSWGNSMDQVLLLVRNPRWAIPSYHNMRFELDYASDWDASYLKMLFTYKERPQTFKWESWRDNHFNIEINRWSNFIDFWMQGGFQEGTNEAHSKCFIMDIECHPKAVVDFDRLYQENPSSEFYKITTALQSSLDPTLVLAQATDCVLESLKNKKEYHQGFRENLSSRDTYKFSLEQTEKMLNRTIELRDKYSEEPYSTLSNAGVLVPILNQYIADIEGYFLDEVVPLFLDDYLISAYDTRICASLQEDTESSVCTFMGVSASHAIFTTNEYPDNYPYALWLEERRILVRFYYNYFGGFLAGWVTDADHCTWTGVTCDDTTHRVESLNLAGVQFLSGSYPSDLINLHKLKFLDLSGNSLTELVPNNLCDRSWLTINGDAGNCNNVYNDTDGVYLEGCCTYVVGL